MKETKQPEALRLADAVERYNAGVHSQAIFEDYSKAAAELRRLFELAHDQHSEIYGLRLKVRRLHALNQELLEALTSVTLVCENVHHSKKDRHGFAEPCPVTERIRAAIAKAQGASNE